MNFDISYLNHYSNQNKYYRLIKYAQTKQQIIPQVISILEQAGMFLACYNLATLVKMNYQKDELSYQRRQITEKKSLAQDAKNKQNRMLLKQYSIELGNLYLQFGDLEQAYESYFRAHENNTTQECLEYANSWVFCMIIMNQFMHYKVLNVNPKDSNLYEYQKWVLMSAIRNYMRMDYKNFLNDLLSIDHNYLQSVDFVTSYQDLSKYFAIACLITKLPKDIIEILQNPLITQLLDVDSSVIETLNCYIDYDFVQLIHKVQIMINQLENDLLSVSQLNQISEKVINTLLKQYIINFKRMSLVSLSSLIQLNLHQTQEMVEKIIRLDNLNYVVDPIELIVQEKYTQEQLELRQCKQFSQTVIKSIDAMYLKMLKEQQT